MIPSVDTVTYGILDFGRPIIEATVERDAKWSAASPAALQSGQSRDPDWIVELRSKFQKVSGLPDGWDGPRSRSPDATLTYRVESIVRSALAPLAVAKAPFVVPLADGGLQVEWHRAHADLEVTFFASGKVSALFEDRITGFEAEAGGDEAIDLLLSRARWVAEATGNVADVPVAPASAAISAAA